MASKSKSSSQGAWGCLIVVGLVVGGCNALFGGADQEPAAMATPTPIASHTSAWTPPEPSSTPKPATPSPPQKRLPDLDRDGIADRNDNDKDGDGIVKSRDLDDRDPDKGRKPPKRTPKPQPVREPAPLAKAHPGGFCGSPGAVGMASNGRTYTCMGGHWRR